MEDPRSRDFEPHERASIRDVVDAFVRGRWLRSLSTKIIAWLTAMLVLMGLFRDWIATVFT